MIENKIIFIAHNWVDASLSFQSKALALALSNRNRIFFLNAKKNGFKNVSINQNLIVLEWPSVRPTGWKDFFFAVKLMRKNKPDIIVTNFAANDIMLFVSWIFKVKIRVCYFHTMVAQYIADHKTLGFRQRINIFRKGFVFRMATHMLPSTTAAKFDLIKYYKVKQNRAFIFPNAMPDKSNRNENNSNNKIGFLGRLDFSKGVDILINAFAKIADKIDDARLEVTGRGIKERDLKKQIEALGLTDKILFKGAIPYHEVLNFLGSLNFLVIPSRADNLPTVALEALSVGTPLIGSDAGGIPDIITPEYNGLLFKSENANDLSHKMLSLLNNREQRNTMAKNARKVFEEKYCINNLLPRFEKLLDGQNYLNGH